MSLKRNIIGLGVAQLFNYILPLVQFPYLSRILGTEYFGLILFGLSLLNMIQVITDYGLDIYLTKKISVQKKLSKIELGMLLYQSLMLKFSLFFIAILIYLVVVLNSNLVEHYNLAVMYGLTVFVNSFNISWLFQGLEKSYIYARIIIISRMLSLIFVLILIKTKEDYYIYGWIMFFYSLSIVLISYFIVINKWHIYFKQCGGVRILAIKSFEFFISRVGSSLFVSGCGVFLGMYGTLYQVSMYGAAERLYAAGVGVFGPIITALIPYMNRTKNYIVFYKISICVITIAILGMCFGFYFGENILDIIFGSSFVDAKNTLNILMLSLGVSALGMLFGYPALLPLGKERYANLSVIIGGCIQVLFFVSFVLFNIEVTAYNVALSFLISNVVATIYRLYVFIKVKSTHSD